MDLVIQTRDAKQGKPGRLALGRRDNRHRSIRSSILERPIPYIHRQTRRKWRSRNILGDIRELPFADKSFDFIYETCLCHVAGCDVDQAIRELSRVARQGLFFGSIVREMGNGTDEDWEDTFYGIKTLLDLRQWSERFLANGFRRAIASQQILSKVWEIEKQANNDDPWYPGRGSTRYCFYTPC